MTTYPALRTVTTTEWADSVTAAGLNPGPALGYRTIGSGYDVAVHIALSGHLTDAAQAELVREIQEAVSNTVHRVLCVSPVRIDIRPAAQAEEASV